MIAILAAGATEGDGGVNGLEFHQGVQQHALVAIEFYLDVLHVGLGILVRIVAVDLKFQGTCHNLPFCGTE